MPQCGQNDFEIVGSDRCAWLLVIATAKKRPCSRAQAPKNTFLHYCEELCAGEDVLHGRVTTPPFLIFVGYGHLQLARVGW